MADEPDVYEIGLRRAIDPAAQPALAARLIEARSMFRERLHAAHQDRLIETFEAHAYNTHASLAENILFGTPVGPEFALENLAGNPYLRRVIDEAGLTGDFFEMGRKLAALKAEIFRDLPPDHEFFKRFSFIDAGEIPAYEAILRHIDAYGIDALSESDRNRLLAYLNEKGIDAKTALIRDVRGDC